MADDRALSLAKATIQHFKSQLEAVDQAIAGTIDNDPELCARRTLLVSISGVGETLAGIVLAELPGPEVLGPSAAVAAYAGLNSRQHQSGTSINPPARISKIGNAGRRTALYMPALSARRYNPAIAALVGRLKAQWRLTGKQIVVAAMRKLMVISFGVLKSGKEFDPPSRWLNDRARRATAWRRSHGQHRLGRGAAVKPRSPSGQRAGLRVAPHPNSIMPAIETAENRPASPFVS